MDTKSRSDKRVLVVDDQHPILHLLETSLAGFGFEVVVAHGGAEGVRVFGERHPTIDAVLLDVQMPGMDGPATLARLIQIEPRVRCLFMSGDTSPYTTADLLALGAAGLIRKPFTSLDDLGRMLWNLCSADR